MRQLDWIYEIEDYEKAVEKAVKDRDDLSVVLEILQAKNGVDAFITLYSEFNKSSIKLVEKVLNELERVYVYQHRHKPADKIARLLDIDPQTVYAWWREFGVRKNGKIKHDASQISFLDSNE